MFKLLSNKGNGDNKSLRILYLNKKFIKLFFLLLKTFPLFKRISVEGDNAFAIMNKILEEWEF